MALVLALTIQGSPMTCTFNCMAFLMPPPSTTWPAVWLWLCVGKSKDIKALFLAPCPWPAAPQTPCQQARTYHGSHVEHWQLRRTLAFNEGDSPCIGFELAFYHCLYHLTETHPTTITCTSHRLHRSLQVEWWHLACRRSCRGSPRWRHSVSRA